jgi:hypothetical protein
MTIRGFPQYSGAGLPFATGIVVVFVLGTQGQPQPVGHEVDLVLEKGAVELVASIRQIHLEGFVKVTGDRPVAGAHGQVLAPAERCLVLEIEVDGVEGQIEHRVATFVEIIIGLKGQRPIVAQFLAPASQQIPALGVQRVIPDRRQGESPVQWGKTH